MSANSYNADNETAVGTTCPSLHDVIQPVCALGTDSLKYPLTIGAASRKEAVYWACVCCIRRVIEGADGDMICAEHGTVLPELCYRVRVTFFERATATELWVCLFDNMMKRFVATEACQFEKMVPVGQTAVVNELVGKIIQVTLRKVRRGGYTNFGVTAAYLCK